MKKILLAIIIIGIAMSSCTGVKVKIDPNLSPAEAEAVNLLAATLERGSTLESYEVLTGEFPLALADDGLKVYRDDLYKARLDYRTCMTRGLTDAANKNLVIIDVIQNNIKEIIANNAQQHDDYIIVLAKVKEKRRGDDKTTGIIGVLEPNPVKMIERKEVITPVVNNAIMLYEAEKGILAETADQNLTPASVTDNPVTAFILSCDAK